MPEDNAPKGFAGLDDLVSKVEAPPPPPLTLAPVSPPPASAASSTPRVSKPAAPAKPAWRPNKQVVWIVVIAGVLGLGWRLGQPKEGSRSTGWSRAEEIQPPVGEGQTLGANQIRYCLAERIRLDSWSGLATRPSPAGIKAFNGAVDDYNSRCGRFRYKRGLLETVRSEVDGRKAELQAEGAARARLNP